MAREATKTLELTDDAVRRTLEESRAAETGMLEEWRFTTSPGLVLRVRNGSGTWYLMYQTEGGKRQRFRIGLAGRGNLKAADAAAKALIEKDAIAKQHADPQRDRVVRRETEQSQRTFDEVFEDYMAWAEDRGHPSKGTRGLYRRSIEKDALPKLGKLHIRDVSADLITAVLREVEKRGALVQANNTRIAISAVLKYAANERLIKSTPMHEVKKGTLGSARKRHATADELVKLWNVIERETWDVNGVTRKSKMSGMRPLLKLIVLTGQRPIEVAGARIEELALDKPQPTWTIRGDVKKGGRIVEESRIKNGREQTVYLSKQAAALFREAIGERTRGFVFPGKATKEGEPGHLRVSSVGQCMSRLTDRAKIEDLTSRDMRRAIGNWLKGAGIGKEVRDVVLNHIDRSVDGQHYANDQAVLAPLATRAWQVWADHVDSVVSGTETAPSNVFPLARVSA